MSMLLLGVMLGFAGGVVFSVRAEEKDAVSWTLFKSLFGTKKN